MRLSSVLSHSAVIFLFIVASLVKCQSPENYRLPNNVVPSIYDLHIVVDLDGLKFSGTETIYVRANQPTSVIELHLLDLSVSDVQVIEGTNAIAISEKIYKNDTQMFKITLDASLMAGRKYQIKMNFEGEIRDDMKGLYRSSYYENQVVKYCFMLFMTQFKSRQGFSLPSSLE
jgi:Peptidase M1 N-terminal domain